PGPGPWGQRRARPPAAASTNAGKAPSMTGGAGRVTPPLARLAPFVVYVPRDDGRLRALSAERRAEEPRIVRPEPVQVGHHVDVLEARTPERRQPALGGEEARARPRVPGERYVVEAVKELEGKLGPYGLVVRGTDALAGDEPAALRQRRARFSEHLLEPAGQVEDVHPPHQGTGSRRHPLGCPRSVQIELTVRQRQTR